MMEIVGVLLGVMKFWDEVTWLIKTLQGTPAEQRAKAMASVHNAFSKASQTQGDTSDIEKIIAD